MYILFWKDILKIENNNNSALFKIAHQKFFGNFLGMID